MALRHVSGWRTRTQMPRRELLCLRERLLLSNKAMSV